VVELLHDQSQIDTRIFLISPPMEPQLIRMSNIAQPLTWNGAPIDRSIGLILVILLFGGLSGRAGGYGYGVYGHGAAGIIGTTLIEFSLLLRELLISLGLFTIAVPSIADENATGMMAFAYWSLAGADMVFARSNAYSTN
jgi:hypothetical protein